MSYRSEDREYDKMQEGFYVTRIEKRIRMLERENKVMALALETIINGTENRYPKPCLMDLEEVNICARAALEEK